MIQAIVVVARAIMPNSLWKCDVSTPCEESGRHTSAKRRASSSALLRR
jgi:hypothetical protein